MNELRINLLKTYIKEEPNDPFNHYALACEYQTTEPKKAITIFNNLLTEHPNYLPTYYQAAQLQAMFGHEEEALETYAKGIALAKEQNNPKAIKELSSAKLNLEFEMD